MKTRIQENFVIQIWYGIQDKSESRIRIQHVRSGEIKIFLNFEDAMTYMEHFADEEIEKLSTITNNLK